MVGNVLRVRYELTQFLHENPVFKTFAAFDKVQSREVSVRLIKEPFAGDAELVESLGDVVKRLSSVRQTNIEELSEVDSDDASVFIVGQLTKGSSISERLKKLATFSVPAAVEVGIALSEGLQALHRAGFAHGCLGGGTVAMQADGETRLQESGLWLSFFSNPQSRDILIAYNASYTAPEISKGGLPTPASDIYSLGILLFELVTGRLPYHGETALAIALQHATDSLPSAKQVNPSVPQALDQIIRKAMNKLPSERYANGGEILSDLRMQQDALRFGKSLTIPAAAPSIPAESPATKAAVAEPAGPKKQPKAKRAVQNESDVPKPLIWSMAVVLGGVIFAAIALIVTNVNKRKSVLVPQLSHLSYTEASKIMDGMGLHLGKLRSVSSDTIPADTILSTTPQAGAKVFEGEDVRAVVSAGSNFVEVPDLRGMTPDKAKAMLASVGLQLDNAMDKVRDKDLAEGLIVSQAEGVGGKYQRGTSIHVSVSSGRNSETTAPEHDNTEKYVYRMDFVRHCPHRSCSAKSGTDRLARHEGRLRRRLHTRRQGANRGRGLRR